jgi:predicted ester cyclase
LVQRFFDYRRSSIEKGKSKSASSVAQKALHSLNRESSRLSNDEYFSKLHRVFITFLENKFEERLLGDTMPQLSARLSARGLESSMVEDIVTNLEEFEFARFASSSKDNTERKKQEEQIKDLIRTVGNARISPAIKRKEK